MEKNVAVFKQNLFEGKIRNLKDAATNVSKWFEGDASSSAISEIKQILGSKITNPNHRDSQSSQCFEFPSLLPAEKMTLELSDLYETFDSTFKRVIPKTHS